MLVFQSKTGSLFEDKVIIDNEEFLMTDIFTIELLKYKSGENKNILLLLSVLTLACAFFIKIELLFLSIPLLIGSVVLTQKTVYTLRIGMYKRKDFRKKILNKDKEECKDFIRKALQVLERTKGINQAK